MNSKLLLTYNPRRSVWHPVSCVFTMAVNQVVFRHPDLGEAVLSQK